jgi:hypothetical protein
MMENLPFAVVDVYMERVRDWATEHIKHICEFAEEEIAAEEMRYGPEWSLENVARRLRFVADRGIAEGTDRERDRAYRTKCSAYHVPTCAKLIFVRSKFGGERPSYHVILGFCGEDGVPLPWNTILAERWLRALFGRDRPRVQRHVVDESFERNRGVRTFILRLPQGPAEA